MTAIYVLTGRKPNTSTNDRDARLRDYFTTEQGAREALVQQVLDGTMCTPVRVEAIEPHGPDVDPLPSGEDITERVRRLEAVAEAAGQLADAIKRNGVPLCSDDTQDACRNLLDPVEALREYAPEEVAAPVDPVRSTSSVRDELHKLAPLPWIREDNVVRDAQGDSVFLVDYLPTDTADKAVASLLVQLVNGDHSDTSHGELERLRAVERRADETSTWCGDNLMHRAVRYIRTGSTGDSGEQS